MKKKILSFVLAICMVVPCVLLLTACGGGLKMDVEYKKEKAEVVWGSEEEKAEILSGMTEEEFLSFAGELDVTFKFAKDGTMTTKSLDEDSEEETLYYTKEGKTIKVYQDEAKEGTHQVLTVEGDKLVLESKVDDDYTTVVKIYFKA